MVLRQFIQLQKDEEVHGLFEYKAARPHGRNDHRTYRGVEGTFPKGRIL